MRKLGLPLRALAVCLILLLTECGPRPVADLTGTWIFKDGPENHTFVFRQSGRRLTGTCALREGTYEVSGSISGNQATFGFHYQRGREKWHMNWTATIDNPATMHGRADFTSDLRNSAKGPFQASKK